MNRPLRIGIDARELLGSTTGVGRYLGELLRRWTVRPDASARRFVLYSPEPLPIALPPDAIEPRIVDADGAGRGTWWEQWHLRGAIKADALDVFFAPAYTAPIGLSVPLAVTIHDVSFAAHPEWFRPREGLRRRLLTKRTARAAQVVFTDSEFSSHEIATHLSVDSGKVCVFPPGVTRPESGASSTSRRERTVLFVGSIFNRRRLPDLIAAFAKATRDLADARLVIVGDDRTWPPLDLRAIAAQYGVAQTVDYRQYLPDRALAELYASASAFAFLSEYEGFGLTPLEAMSAGLPPIVLDTPVAREVYGDAAIFVAKGDIDGTARELRRLLLDPWTAAPLLERARDVLARYSWDVTADRTLAQIERVARR
jgi:glycosyltransferase involved in cell wall biosynthesis